MNLDENQKENFEERAGILEYMAGFTREESERLAMEMVELKNESITQKSF